MPQKSMTLSHPKQKNPTSSPVSLKKQKEQTDWSALWLRKYQNFDIIFQWVQILELWVHLQIGFAPILV